MCFLNQVIKVLVAAAISGADTVFSLGSRTHLASLGRALQYVAEIDLFMRRRLYDYVRGEFVCVCARVSDEYVRGEFRASRVCRVCVCVRERL